MKNKSRIGIVGMGVMGKSLALNIAGKDIPVSVYNRHIPEKEENIASRFAEESNLPQLKGYDVFDDFLASLEQPRRILLMITAGKPVDAFLMETLPYLEKDDIIMDGGNSFYKDTAEREKRLLESGVLYLGIGISGGEEGALKGPSLMPGGNPAAYEKVKDILTTAAATDRKNKPCCSYVGEGGAGHFVKMIHNGIEYAEMQLLAETYDLLKRNYGLGNDEIAGFFQKAGANGAGGFLTEATIDILQYKKDGEYLLDKILDRSEQKGTGGWTVISALDHGMPLSSISEAVMARLVSSQKERRVSLSAAYEEEYKKQSYSDKVEKELIKALNSARLVNHLIGFDFIKAVAEENGWHASLSEIARIWTNGCIIRSDLMEALVTILKESEDAWSHNLIIKDLKPGRKALTEIIHNGFLANISLPVMSACLNYLNAITAAESAASLIQAQRDYFGAHTYQRKDMPGDKYFHTQWIGK